MSKWLLWSLLAGVVLTAGILVELVFRDGRTVSGFAGVSSSATSSRATEPIGPALTSLAGHLVDADGRSRSLAELNGRPFIAAAIYTRCPTVCPTLVARLQRLEHAAAATDSLRFVLFSLDPAHDTPERWRSFAREHALGSGDWTLLTPEPSLLPSLLRSLRVGSTPESDGSITHSSIIAFADREGRVRDRRTATDDNPGNLLTAWRAMIR